MNRYRLQKLSYNKRLPQTSSGLLLQQANMAALGKRLGTVSSFLPLIPRRGIFCTDPETIPPSAYFAFATTVAQNRGPVHRETAAFQIPSSIWVPGNLWPVTTGHLAKWPEATGGHLRPPKSVGSHGNSSARNRHPAGLLSLLRPFLGHLCPKATTPGLPCQKISMAPSLEGLSTHVSNLNRNWQW